MPNVSPAALSEDIRSVIVFTAEIGQLGGAERSLLALARWFYEQGKPMLLLTYFDHCNFLQYADFPLRLTVLQPSGGARAKIEALREYLRGWQGSPPLASSYQPTLHTILSGRRHFHSLMHDTAALIQPPETRTWKDKLRISFSNRIIRHGFARGNRMIVTSEFLQQDCWRDFRVRADIARMGGLAPASAFRKRPVGAALRALSVCRIEGNKRVDWMIDAFKELESAETPLSQRVDWRLDLAGQGSLLETMRSRVQELGLAHRIHFHGFVPDAELDALYEEANLFLMPAVQGYGIPAIEALERGSPVVLHRESGVSDLLLQTPWAAVIHGGKEEMRPKLEGMIDWLLRNEHLSADPPPRLPTENEWAARVAQLCGYTG